MKSIGIIIPYYGKFPNYFNLFLKSCEMNPTIDWLIFTDIKDKYNFPSNVHRIEMSFDDLHKMFQSKFDFEISLKNPYKLCDYKTMQGYLFSDYLQGYDYWGYSDVDMLFGDLRKYLTDDILEQNDKIGHLGHLTIYRNVYEVNTLFMKKIYGVDRYREVLSSDAHFSFTEWYQININDIFVDQRKKIWFCNDFFDVEPYEDNFHRIYLEVPYDNLKSRKWVKERKFSFASWENGHVYQWIKEHGKWIKKEYMYVHFQKRRMEVNVDNRNLDRFLCVPDEFVPYEEVIPQKYVSRSLRMMLFNKKHWKHWNETTKYFIAEKTGPIRHVLFKRNK